MHTVKECTKQSEWDTLVHQMGGHPLQLWGWGEVKAKHGWTATRYIVWKGSEPALLAQVLTRRLPWPFRCLAYMPRGPVGRDTDALGMLAVHVKSTVRPVCLIAEPDTVGEMPWRGWRSSMNRILLARTAVLDLTMSTDDLLAKMSKKTRQYVRKSANEGVTVSRAVSRENIDACLELYRLTATRAGFSLHDAAYYHDIFNELADDTPVYMAQKDSRVVAFLWPIVSSTTAFELYGGMNEEGQALRANYHLKWSVILAMKERGVDRYDVNGLLNDGVTSFKKGFIPDETTMSGTFVRPMSAWFFAWESALPLAKRIVQRVRR